MEGYETTKDVATRMGLTDSRIRQLCLAGAFPSAKRVGSERRGEWFIPEGDLPEKNSEKSSENT